ncbi:MAG TPA: hypothetical protein VD928_00845 [Candidatus Paceibacterota bacterium]|nr:hypothetical protein [Candidatus Paceibacterota bacterium]
MRKFFVTVAALAAMSQSTYADEGERFDSQVIDGCAVDIFFKEESESDLRKVLRLESSQKLYLLTCPALATDSEAKAIMGKYIEKNALPIILQKVFPISIDEKNKRIEIPSDPRNMYWVGDVNDIVQAGSQ